MNQLWRFVVALMVLSLVPVGVMAEGSQEQDGEDEIVIGSIVPTLSAQFWNRYVDFMEEGAEELGVELITLNAENSPDALARHIEDLVSRGVDGIIYVPYWSSGQKGLIETQREGIPLMFTDVYVEDAEPQGEYDNYQAFVGPSDEEAGYQMGKMLFEHTEAADDGTKYIGVVNGTPGTSVAEDRREGLERALGEHSEVEVVDEVNGNFVRDESQAAMEDLYQAHPEIKGVWAANGGTATGVMTALKNAGEEPGEDVQVVAMDLNPENVDAIEEGELLFDIGGHWLQGGFALVMMYDYLNGHSIPEDQANVKLDLLPLTQELLPVFKEQYPGGVPEYDFRARSQTYNEDWESYIFELGYEDVDLSEYMWFK